MGGDGQVHKACVSDELCTELWAQVSCLGIQRGLQFSKEWVAFCQIRKSRADGARCKGRREPHLWRHRGVELLRRTAWQACAILNDKRTEGVRASVRRRPSTLSKGSLLELCMFWLYIQAGEWDWRLIRGRQAWWYRGVHYWGLNI